MTRCHWSLQCGFVSTLCFLASFSFAEEVILSNRRKFAAFVKAEVCADLEAALKREAAKAQVVVTLADPEIRQQDTFVSVGSYTFDHINAVPGGLYATFSASQPVTESPPENELGGFYDDGVVVEKIPGGTRDLNVHCSVLSMTDRGPGGIDFFRVTWNKPKLGTINMLGYGGELQHSLSGRTVDLSRTSTGENVTVRFYCVNKCQFYRVAFCGSTTEHLQTSNHTMGKLADSYQIYGRKVTDFIVPSFEWR